jgi:RNA polymerase sigma factor (sigma-70 family)
MQPEIQFHNCFINFFYLARYTEIVSYSDEELLATFLKTNENRYLGVLLERHVRFVFVVCMKYLKDEQQARDMSMQVFEKVLTDVHRFEIRNFKSWLHVVTKNSCLMQLREKKKFKITGQLDEKEIFKNVENQSLLHPDDVGKQEERLVDLEKVIATLETGQRQCIELFYLGEKNYMEVAEITGFSMNQVKSYIQNGKRNLKNLLMKNQKLLLMLLFCTYFDIR